MWQVLTLQPLRVMSDNYSQSSWSLMSHASIVRNIAKVVPTQILPRFPPFSENQGFRWRIISFLLQRAVDPSLVKSFLQKRKWQNHVTISLSLLLICKSVLILFKRAGQDLATEQQLILLSRIPPFFSFLIKLLWKIIYLNRTLKIPFTPFMKKLS